MPAPLLGFLAKKAAVKTVKETDKRFPGGIAAAGVASVAFFVFLIMTLVMAFMGTLGSGAGGAAIAAATAACTSGGTNVDASQSAIDDIPPVALDAYRQAGNTTGIDWTFIAGIGKVESDHGRFGGRHLTEAGDSAPPIIGVALDGSGGTAAIRDTDKGRWDHDTVWDRAVGPMQFIPSTWAGAGKDGNFDGEKSPHNIYDAALATAYYLKNAGAPGDMHAAIFSYNHAEWYVAKVMDWAEKYRGSGVDSVKDGNIFDAAGSPAAGGPTSRARIVQADIGPGVSRAAVTHDVQTVAAAGPDFITFNDMDGRNPGVYTPEGYSSYAPDSPQAAAENPVVWRSDRWDVADYGSVSMLRSDLPGATRYATWVTLESTVNSATVSVVSTHALPNPDGSAERIRLMGAFTTKLTALISQLSNDGAVLVGGNFNVNYNADKNRQRPEFPYHALKMANTVSTWEALGGAPADVINYVFMQRGNGLDPVENRTIGLDSPLAAVKAEFRLTDTSPDDSADTVPAVQIGDAFDIPNNSATGSGDGWTLPEAEGTYTITATFGQAGPMWSSGYHTGTDFAGPEGSKVFAAAAGIFHKTPTSWAGPNYVTIDHGTIDGHHIESTYAHMQSLNPALRDGDRVEGGTWLGNEGQLGNVTGPHLHFEVHSDGHPVDPMIWLNHAGAPDPSSSGIGLFGCGPGSYTGTAAGVGPWGGYSNGHIPLDAMCKLSFYPTYLRCDAAAALEKLNKVFENKFGHNFAPVGGYRSYEDQVICQQEKGNLCATPGTSNHGWGLAADLGGNVNVATSPEHQWMLKNAAAYGWILPDWARPGGSKPEPWHWEFGLTPDGVVLPPGSNAVVDQFYLTTFNVLGASHTDGSGPHEKRGFDPYQVRMPRLYRILASHHSDVVGFQEFQNPQLAMFKRDLGDEWATFSPSARITDNTIAWRRARFEFVTGYTVPIKYFGGHFVPMPIVVLKSKTTGAKMLFFDVHNPASTRGDASALRAYDLAVERERVTAETQARQHAVFLTGDMNDPRFYCPFTSNGVMQSSAGGSNSAGRCNPPPRPGIDWIFGNRYATFISHLQDESPLVHQTTDHPVVTGLVSVVTPMGR